LRGSVKNTKAITPTDDATVLVATLDSAFAPTYTERAICQGSGSKRFLLSIYSSGNVYISRYSNSTTLNEEITNGAWLNCFATWFIG
jgi:hypothetical protein